MSDPSEVDQGAFWVRSIPGLLDGTYRVEVTQGDVVLQLDPHTGLRYASECFRVAHAADHDAAVLQQMEKLDMPGALMVAARFVSEDLRPGRIVDDRATAPFRFVPGVAADGLRPFITLEVNRSLVGQWTAAQLVDHAVGVLGALASCQLDQDVRDALITSIGLPEDSAREFVAALVERRTLR